MPRELQPLPLGLRLQDHRIQSPRASPESKGQEWQLQSLYSDRQGNTMELVTGNRPCRLRVPEGHPNTVLGISLSQLASNPAISYISPFPSPLDYIDLV